jgi:hypothetical protein
MTQTYMTLDLSRAIRANGVRKNMKDVIASGRGSEAPASPRHMQLFESRGRGGAISFFASVNPDCFGASLPGLARRSRGGARNDKSRLFPQSDKG